MHGHDRLFGRQMELGLGLEYFGPEGQQDDSPGESSTLRSREPESGDMDLVL